MSNFAAPANYLGWFSMGTLVLELKPYAVIFKLVFSYMPYMFAFKKS